MSMPRLHPALQDALFFGVPAGMALAGGMRAVLPRDPEEKDPGLAHDLMMGAQKILQAMRNRVGRQLDAEIQPGTGDAVNQYVDQLIASNRR